MGGGVMIRLSVYLGVLGDGRPDHGGRAGDLTVARGKGRPGHGGGAGDLTVARVGHGRPGHGGGAGEGHVHPRVVKLAVVVHDGALERHPVVALVLQSGEDVPRLRAAHVTRHPHARPGGVRHQVVQLQASPELIGRLYLPVSQKSAH
eukprot:1178076-Prorocentrum_minimum.AAC.3